MPQTTGLITEIITDRTGYDLLTDPLLNKGTAFTQDERDAFDLNGLLPPAIGDMEGQVDRRMRVLRAFATDLERYAFLRELQDTNETLFYALLEADLEGMMPLVYTPTVGLGCEEFSRVYRKPRGLFLSPPHVSRLDQIFSNPRFDHVEAICLTDGERILGLGDQGAGGMGIAIGKLALYTACGGIDPRTTLPIMLDVGTDNQARLDDPLYVGWHHRRLRGFDYDDFVEAVVSAIQRRWPHVLLQWEDFARANATRLLNRYRDRLCTFNDDIQGTAAVATGAVLAAINVTGVPLAKQRIAVLGAGSAGTGIASFLMRAMIQDGVPPDDAARRFFMVDKDGLLTEGMNDIEAFQRPFLQPADVAKGWTHEDPDRTSLLDVVMNAGVTTLIGVSGVAGAFDSHVVSAMAARTPRPVIFPLSNPTSRAEARPQDVIDWSEGKAIVGTGSPFPVITHNGVAKQVDQTNNSYIFPGVALAVTAVRARRITDEMLMVAARALAAQSPALADPHANLLPPVGDMRAIAYNVAMAVARKARNQKLCDDMSDAEIERAVRARIWRAVYVPYRRA